MRVQVSTLNKYSFCPRAVYLSKVLKLKPESSPERLRGLFSHVIRKELSIRQSRLFGRIHDIEGLNTVLVEELDRVLEEAPHIYRGLLGDFDYGGFIPEIHREVLGEVELFVGKLRLMVEEVGFEDALKNLIPWKVEYTVRSESLRLSGRIDRVMKNPFYVPVELKTGVVPRGIWMGDRLQTCAYALLLEDTLGLEDPIPYGFVEYTRVLERRPVLTTEQLRRKVFETRDEIVDLFNGRVPEVCPQENGRKCKSCGFKRSCYEI